MIWTIILTLAVLSPAFEGRYQAAATCYLLIVGIWLIVMLVPHPDHKLPKGMWMKKIAISLLWLPFMWWREWKDFGKVEPYEYFAD